MWSWNVFFFKGCLGLLLRSLKCNPGWRSCFWFQQSVCDSKTKTVTSRSVLVVFYKLWCAQIPFLVVIHQNSAVFVISGYKLWCSQPLHLQRLKSSNQQHHNHLTYIITVRAISKNLHEGIQRLESTEWISLLVLVLTFSVFWKEKEQRRNPTGWEPAKQRNNRTQLIAHAWLGLG